MVTGVFALVTRGHFLTSASKFNIEPDGGFFDVSPENDRASLNVETPKWRTRHKSGFHIEEEFGIKFCSWC